MPNASVHAHAGTDCPAEEDRRSGGLRRINYHHRSVVGTAPNARDNLQVPDRHKAEVWGAECSRDSVYHGLSTGPKLRRSIGEGRNRSEPLHDIPGQGQSL